MKRVRGRKGEYGSEWGLLCGSCHMNYANVKSYLLTKSTPSLLEKLPKYFDCQNARYVL